MAPTSVPLMATAAVALAVAVAVVSAAPAIQLNADITAVSRASSALPDWEEIRAEIKRELDDHPLHDDGTIAPAVLRLGWHSAATYDPDSTPRGGSEGATMRFEPEAGYEDNKGLALAREAMQRIHLRHPLASHADLWVLASYVAVEHLEGPRIEFVPGRRDAPSGGDLCPPEDRLPRFDDDGADIRAKFSRMGLSGRDLVALMGGHSIGHTHPENSNFPYYKWDLTPTKFDNSYYSILLNQGWIYDDEDKDYPFYFNRSWIMLLSDILLRDDPQLRAIAEEYEADEAAWHADFASAFKRLTELGMPGVGHHGSGGAVGRG